MKLLPVQLLLVLLLVALLSGAQPGQWNYVAPNRFYFGSDEIGDITFVDSLNGYALDQGNPKILQTTNGGLSWNEKPTNLYGGIQTKVQFLTAQMGWIANGYLLSATSDRGNSWQSIIDTIAFAHLNAGIADFQFLDALNGFAVGYYGAFKTNDGGNTWTSIMPWNIDSSWNKVFFLSPDTGWLFSMDSMIAKTTDGGQTWTSEKVSYTNGASYDLIEGAYFYTPQTGVAISLAGSVFKTYDGGNTWIFNQNLTLASAFLYKFRQDGFIYGPTSSTSNILSTDSGNTWTSIPMPDLGPDAMFCFTPLKWYVGAFLIYETENGGATFSTDSQQYLTQEAPLINYEYTGTNSITSVLAQYTAPYLTGYNDYFDYQSLDGGISWIQSGAIGSYNQIINIQQVSPSCYFVDGDTGVSRYQNSNLDYVLPYPYRLAYALSPDSFIVYEIPYDTISGQAYLTDTLILKKTTNGGITWSTIYTSDLGSYDYYGEWNDFSMVRFMNWDTGIVAVLQYFNGYGDSLWSKETITLDGGATWTNYPLNTSSGMIISTKISPTGELYCMRNNNLYNGNYTLWKLNTSMQWDFINYINPQGNPGGNLGGSLYFQDFGWSSDSILWSCNTDAVGINPNMPTLVYSTDDGISWNNYNMSTNPFTMFKQLRNGQFIGGTSIGEILQYDGTVANGRIKGSVYYDFNANGIFDDNDIWANSYPVTVNPGSLVTYTTQGGDFTLPVDSGSYVIAPDTTLYFHSFPVSQQVTLNSQTAVSMGTVFALQPIDTTLKDLVLYSADAWYMYPGATHNTLLMYCNVGAEPIAPTLTLILDTALAFSRASISPTTQNGDTLIWNLPMIYPGQNSFISVTSVIDSGVPVGDTIINYSSLLPIIGDQTPWNNSDTSSFVIGASIDPNYKQVTPSTIAANQKSAQNLLTYTIYFQNTGTDSTHFIVVKDQLDPSLNPASLHVLGASAPVDYHFEQGNLLVFRFNNYQLPDSSTNPAGSRGFVSFTLSPKAKFLTGDTIANTAAVYFDYNAPVNTNTAKTAVSGTFTAIQPVFGQLDIKIFPNPANSIVHLLSSNDFDYKLYDLCGRPITGNHVVGGRLDLNVSNLASGLYYLRITQNGETKGFSLCVVTH